jgi:hypothetical protein
MKMPLKHHPMDMLQVLSPENGLFESWQYQYDLALEK